MEAAMRLERLLAYRICSAAGRAVAAFAALHTLLKTLRKKDLVKRERRSALPRIAA